MPVADWAGRQPLGHLGQEDQIEAQALVAPQALLDRPPEHQLAGAVNALGKTRRQQRPVVIAEVRTESFEHAGKADRTHGKRQQKQRPIRVTSEDDSRPSAVERCPSWNDG